MTKNESFITDEEAQQQWGTLNSAQFSHVFDDDTNLWKRIRITDYVLKSEVEHFIIEAKIEELKLMNKATLGKSITPENNNDPTWQGGLRFARNTFKRYKLNRINELTNQHKG